MRLRIRSVAAPAITVALGSLLLAAPPGPGRTPMTINCTPVGYQGTTLSAVGTIKPAVAVLGPPPAGSCGQITLTAWRNNFDYNCNLPRSPHESTTARGHDLSNCSYDLPVEMGHMVVIKATTTLPNARVVLTYNDSSETSPGIWEEKHPITFNWHLKVVKKPQLPQKGK